MVYWCWWPKNLVGNKTKYSGLNINYTAVNILWLLFSSHQLEISPLLPLGGINMGLMQDFFFAQGLIYGGGHHCPSCSYQIILYLELVLHTSVIIVLHFWICTFRHKKIITTKQIMCVFLLAYKHHAMVAHFWMTLISSFLVSNATCFISLLISVYNFLIDFLSWF